VRFVDEDGRDRFARAGETNGIARVDETDLVAHSLTDRTTRWSTLRARRWRRSSCCGWLDRGGGQRCGPARGVLLRAGPRPLPRRGSAWRCVVRAAS